MRSFNRMTIVLLFLALVPLIGTADDKPVRPPNLGDAKLPPPPQGPDLTVYPTTFLGTCSEANCENCVTQTGKVYVKNGGNKIAPGPITITVKRQNVVVMTWTTPSVAPGTTVVVGNLKTFTWACNNHQFEFYTYTVDTQNVVAETNESNNTKNYAYYTPRTTFY